ncbi:long-chain fatty acid--CoA ligase [Conexibacter sp. JD483]|uniref:AMP-dependent synthetase/ligase n=1 Tax=unclassified Conexibacter TaxID=2627773 RepID=UPI0027226B71|nr:MULTISPECIES: long-chain fatty acid--CoA ligase [unclassified Conexibacter]MDO8188826.1 long-chain fatty acid--CoA ligase [Conexibacter sp. CPCC 205706]MDO8201168.1 long-chain fatty acid--CoA ligase [Conexibacter sp. CPCC 205762]MDR9372744.1 long-chain fatty acid--CoA ligase [Conexibacter sp. JD483]
MEGSTIAASTPQAVDAANLGEALRRTAAAHPDLTAVRTLDGSLELTWAQLRARVDALAGGLARLGVGHGDTVALMLTNRPEFHLADLAVVTLGAAPFSIYLTSSPEQIEYVVGDAQARVAIVEHAFLSRLLEARQHLPVLKHVIVIDPEEGESNYGLLTLEEVEGSNPEFDVDAALAAVTPDDVATLIYTSGTTGPPKGVELAHRNILGAVRAVQEIINLDPGSRVISWLPAAHIAERAAHHYIPVVYAATITTSPDPRAIVQTLPQVRPNWFFAVPRVWEKLKAGLEAMLAAQPEEARARVEGALAAARQRVELLQQGAEVPAELEQAVRAADDAIFSNLRTMLGLDEVVTVNVGAAPTPPDVIAFFHALGIELAELWGMSETCGAGTVNRPGAVRIGTVGPPSPGVEARLAEDGELLVRGACVMRGYRGRPEKTAETIDADGWLHTGDVAEIDADGYVRIVDRKKELIINAAGKNMSPANIEATLKSASPLIGQACVIGDGKPFNTALIVLDADFAPAWAKQQGVGGEEPSLAALAGEERVVAAVQEAVDVANARLSRVEQIKRFTLVEGDWLPGGDELTPTMKLKRRPIGDKYAGAIDGMYVGH